MVKLSPTQQKVYEQLTSTPQCAYSLKCSLSTLETLVKKGVARDVTPRGPGAMFSPTTHFQFVRKD